MKHSNYKYKALDGKMIYVNHWSPEAKSEAILLIVHGMAEYSYRYEDFARFLNQNSIEVIAHDHRGHGKTLEPGDTIGFIAEHDGWNILMSDLDVLFEKTKRENPETPIFILGASMGAIVTVNYLQEYGNKADGYILSALAYKQNLLSDLGKGIARLQGAVLGKISKAQLHNSLSFGAFNNKFKPNRTDFDWLSRDESQVDTYVADPLLGAVFTAQFFYDLTTGVRNIYRSENLGKLDSKTKIFMLAGESDPVAGGPKKIEETYQSIHSYVPGIEKITFEGARHEILNETNKEEVYSVILTWIKTQL